MGLDWHAVDRWLMGEAWTGSNIKAHASVLCERIGPRWSSSAAEKEAVEYIQGQMRDDGLERVELEPFNCQTWAWSRAEARVVEAGTDIDILPFNRCPSFSVRGPIVDVGFGTPREVERCGAALKGAVAVMSLAFEPFTTPIPHAYRLISLAEAGAAAAVVEDKKTGGRMEYHSASDWRDPGLSEHVLPAVTTSREHGTLLRRLASEGRSLTLLVESTFSEAASWNVVGEITGSQWPEEHILLAGHHDTVYGSPGGNDNASGTIAVMETARVLAQARAQIGYTPGRSVRFVTFGAEEQKLQGSSAYVSRHHGPEVPPRLAINLDELSTGNIKGIVLAFPHLRDFIQGHLSAMGDGLKCHVMSQLDPSSDHFPFLRAGIDAAHLWRWRFVGRHADADFHHETADTSDKLNIRELKEYVGQLARILMRLSHVPPEAWPRNPVTPEQVRRRLETERGTVVRVF